METVKGLNFTVGLELRREAGLIISPGERIYIGSEERGLYDKTLEKSAIYEWVEERMSKMPDFALYLEQAYQLIV